MENAALFGFPVLTYLTPSDQLIFIASLSQICYNCCGFLYEFLFCLWACPLRCRNFFQHVKPYYSFHVRPSPFFRRFHPVIPIYYLCIWQQFCLMQSSKHLNCKNIIHITASVTLFRIMNRLCQIQQYSYKWIIYVPLTQPQVPVFFLCTKYHFPFCGLLFV